MPFAETPRSLHEASIPTTLMLKMPFNEQTRIVLPTLAVSALLLLLVGFAAWFLHQSQRKASQLLTHNISRLQAAEELMLIGEQLQKHVDQFLLTGDRTFLKPIAELKQKAEDWLELADGAAMSDENRALVAQLRSGQGQFLLELDRLVNQDSTPNKKRAALSALNDVFEHEVLQPALKYQHFNRDRLVEMTAQNERLSNRMGMVLVLLGLSGALAGLLAGFLVARGVQRRVSANQQAMAHSEQLATLGRVAAALAHELRNPLTSMRLITQSTESNNNQVSLDSRDFSILEQEIERLDNSIQTFLDYARPPRPEKRSCIAQSLVQQTLKLVERRAAQIGVTIRNELPGELIEFEADPGQIKQVLLNILINGLDALPNGGTISVRCMNRGGADGQATNHEVSNYREFVEIEIADNGFGLPAGLQDQIFDAFVSTKETGTGLGLAICKRIIEDHGGELEAYNAADAGAIFTIRLPKIQSNTMQNPSTPQAKVDS